MPLIRGHHSFDDHFTQIPNAWLRDKALSLGAKGLLAQLMSHAPGWKISQLSLAEQNGIGKDAIRTLINELLSAGYLTRSEERERNAMGYLGGYVYTTVDPTLGQPMLDKPPHKNNNSKEEQDIKNNKRTNAQKFEQDFLDFYNKYPKKVGKLAAQKAFTKAAARYGTGVIMAGLLRLINDPNLPEVQYIPAPAVWLNQGRWEDEPYPARASKLTRQEQNAIEYAKVREQFKNAN